MEGAGYIRETLKSSLLFNFHTGNAVLDTFVTGFIICLSTYLMSVASKFQEIDIRGWFTILFGGSQSFNEISISGKKIEGSRSTQFNYSTTFHALLYQIKKSDCAESKIYKLSEIQLDDDYIDWSDTDSEEDENEAKQKQPDVNLIVSQSTPFKLAENVEAIVNINKEKEKEVISSKEFESVWPMFRALLLLIIYYLLFIWNIYIW